MLWRERKSITRAEKYGEKIETGKSKHQDDEVTTNKHAV